MAGLLPKRRWRRAVVWAGIALSALVLVFYIGGGWYFSGLIDERALDGQSRRDALAPDYTVQIERVEAGAITLRLPEDPGSLTKDGIFGNRWPGGYGQIGAIRETRGEHIVRDFELLTGTTPVTGSMAELDSRSYAGDPSAVGVPFEEVSFDGELGPYPAWFVPGTRDTWVVVVHGNSMTREDALRVLPIVAREGFPALVISFRNDPGAPEDPSGKLRYGATEWRDVASAVRYALRSGAEDAVLVGFSMGGGIVTSFLERSPLRAGCGPRSSRRRCLTSGGPSTSTPRARHCRSSVCRSRAP